MTDKPIVIAHRGASGYLPEHTLEAKKLGFSMGADYLEQDLVLSRDDELIVIHDIHLESVTNVAQKFPYRARDDGHFYVIDFDWDELKQLKVHERIDPKTGLAIYPNRYPVYKGNFNLHKLEDELRLIQVLNKENNKHIGIYPEIKKPSFHHQEGKDLAAKTLEVLDSFGYVSKTDRCFFQCFEQKELQRVRHDLNSDLKLVQLIGGGPDDQMATLDGLNEISDYANGIGPALDRLFSAADSSEGYSSYQLVIFPKLVSMAHEQGLLVHPYTFRKETIPQDIDLVTFGKMVLQLIRIDGFFTDFPDLGVESVNRFLESR